VQNLTQTATGDMLIFEQIATGDVELISAGMRRCSRCLFFCKPPLSPLETFVQNGRPCQSSNVEWFEFSERIAYLQWKNLIFPPHWSWTQPVKTQPE
jgi:hypothetical protein